MPKKVKRSPRLRDLFLYIVIGVAIAALAILLGVYQSKTGLLYKEMISIVGVLFLAGCGAAILLLRWRAEKAFSAARRKLLTK